MMEKMCMLSTRTSLSSSWLPQKHFLTVAEAANVQLLAYLKGKEGHHLKVNPNLSAPNILLIEETTEFLFMKRHPIRHREKKKKKDLCCGFPKDHFLACSVR